MPDKNDNFTASLSTLFQFAGEKSRTANKYSLQTAKVSLEQGVDAETVRVETGWSVGPDNKWRYEISDRDARLMDNSEISREEQSPIVTPLNKVLQHDRLYAAYPHLKNIPVTLVHSNIENIRGKAAIGEDLTVSISVEGDLKNREGCLSVLLHEIQHGIQVYEDFARGGRPEEFEYRLVSVKKELDELDAAYKAHNRIEMLGETPDVAYAYLEGSLNIPVNRIRYFTETYDRGELEERYRDAIEQKKRLDPYLTYRRLAGEVEARNTQARAGLDDLERRHLSPEATKDIDGKVLVRYQGNEMSGAISPANLQNEPTGERAAIQLHGNQFANVFLSNAADVSSIIHEGGHLYLEMFDDIVTSPEASESIKSDFKLILNWFEVEEDRWRSMSLDEKRQHHEKFAESFELYIAEGAAPSLHLAYEFNRFEGWMGGVYRSVYSGIPNAELSDEIRGVFDRMLDSASRRDSEVSGVVYRGVLEQLQAIGIEKDIAHCQAAVFESAFNSFYSRSGLNEQDFLSRYGFSINAEPGQLANERKIDRRPDNNYDGEPESTSEKKSVLPALKVWHGAPSEFESFSTEFISGGEGVQAYGWGMYFASNRDVAKWYRNVLAGNQSGVWVGDRYVPKADIQDIQEKNQRYVDYTAAFFLENMGYVGAKERIARDAEQKRRFMKIPGIAKNAQHDLVVFRSISEKLDEWKNENIRLDTGRLYEVELGPSENEYLDWDAAFEDQSESVKSAFSRENMVFPRDLKGKDLYENLVSQIQKYDKKVRHPAIQKLKSLGHHAEEYTAAEIASKYLDEIGIPGLKYFDQNSRSQGVGTKNYVVFDEENVSVSARYKRNKSNSKFFSPLEKTIKEKLPNTGTPESFKSVLEGLLRKGLLKKEEIDWYGIFPLLSELAEQDPSQKISNADMVDYINHHQIEIVDLVKGEYPSEKEAGFRYAMADKLIEVLSESGDYSIASSNAIQKWHDNPGTWDEIDAEMTLDQILQNRELAPLSFEGIRKIVLEGIAAKETQYSNYRAIQGGANYREVLLTVPELRKPLSDEETIEYSRALTELKNSKTEIEQIRSDLRQLAGGSVEDIPIKQSEFSWALDISNDHAYWSGSIQPPIYVGKGVARSEDAAKTYLHGLLNSSQFEENTTSEIKVISTKIREIEHRLSGFIGEYKTSHWNDTSNILAHVRMDDLVSEDGKRTLVIHEIQSDWHQTGRKKGYQSGDVSDLIGKRQNEFKKQYLVAKENILTGRFPAVVGHIKVNLIDPGTRFEHEQFETIFHGTRIGAYNSKETAQDELAKAWARRHPSVVEAKSDIDNAVGQVPNAPFKKTWPLLSIKYILDYASENDYSQVAWATGKAVADMFDLSSHLQEVQYDPDNESLSGWDHDGQLVIDESGITKDQLSEYLGKELSEKMGHEVESFFSNRSQYEVEFDNENNSFLIFDPNGEVLHDQGGSVLKFDTVESANEAVVEITSADNLPSLKGLDVSVGGEGMIKFYDEVLPSLVGKYVRSMGGTLKKNDEALNKKMHVINMSNEFRAKIAQGQPLFKRFPSSGQGLPANDVENAIASVVKEVGVPVTVVKSPRQLPARLYRTMIRDAAIHDTPGVFDRMTGQGYLIADNINSPKEAVLSYLHEVRGHAAFREALGEKLNPILDQIYDDLPPGIISAIYHENASQLENINPEERRRIIAEEWVAGIAETNPKNTWVQKIVSSIKEWLRQIKPEISFSKEDIVSLLEKGTRKLRSRNYNEPTIGSSPFSVASKNFQVLAKEPNSFRFGSLVKSKHIEEVLHEVFNGNIEVEVKRSQIHHSDPSARSEFAVYLSQGAHCADATIFNLGEKECFEQIFSSKNSGLGAPLYQSLFAWAHNNDKRLVMDPEGITDVNLVRRTEAAISSALRFESTKHIEMYPEAYVALLSDVDYQSIIEYREKATNLRFDNDLVERPQAELDELLPPPRKSYEKLGELYNTLWQTSENETKDIFETNLSGMLEAVRALIVKRVPDLAFYHLTNDNTIVDSRTGLEISKEELPIDPEQGVGYTTALRAILINTNQLLKQGGEPSNDQESKTRNDRQFGSALLYRKSSSELSAEFEGWRKQNCEATENPAPIRKKIGI